MIPCFRQTTRTSYDRNCRQPRIGNVPRPGNSMDRNLHAEKHCDKRFLDRVINLIPDSGLKALWSLIPFFWSHTFYGFTGVITQLGCWENTRLEKLVKLEKERRNWGCLPFIKKIPEILVGNFRSLRTVRVVYHLPKISGLSRRARLDSSYNMKLVQTQETYKW